MYSSKVKQNEIKLLEVVRHVSQSPIAGDANNINRRILELLFVVISPAVSVQPKVKSCDVFQSVVCRCHVASSTTVLDLASPHHA